MARSIRIPGFGRIVVTRDKGGSVFFAREQFQTNLVAEIRQSGKLVERVNLGSGVITNLAVDFLAFGIINGFVPVPKYHQAGSGAAGGASNVGQVTDTNLTTPIGTTATAGTLVRSAAGQIQSVGTNTFAGAATATEWGLFTAAGGSGSAVTTIGTPTAATDLLFDHRGGFSFSVDTSTTITWTWTLTFTAGG